MQNLARLYLSNFCHQRIMKRIFSLFITQFILALFLSVLLFLGFNILFLKSTFADTCFNLEFSKNNSSLFNLIFTLLLLLLNLFSPIIIYILFNKYGKLKDQKRNLKINVFIIFMMIPVLAVYFFIHFKTLKI